MRPRNSGYTSLDSLYAERESISWYWRVVAFAAPWTILAGFLMLPATFDDNPELRVSLAGVSVFAVALMTAGYGMSGLLCIACPSWIFQVESVFLPCLASCSLAFFNILYGFAISHRFRWNAAAIVGSVLASVTAVAYYILALYTHRKLDAIRQQSRVTAVPVEPPRTNDAVVYTNPPSDPIMTHPRPMVASNDLAQLSQEEMTRQQMLTLLFKNENNGSATFSSHQNTFKIDLPRRMSRDFPQTAMTLPTPNRGRQENRGGRGLSLDPNDLEDENESDDTFREQGIRVGRKRRLSREEREERRVEIELGRM